MCLGSFKFWKKHDKGHDIIHPRPLLSTSPAIPSVPTTSVEPIPNASADQVSAPAVVTPSSQSSPSLTYSPKADLQEELWNRAYDAFKDEEPDLVQAYEGLVSSQAILEKWDQMRKSAEDGLDRTQRSTHIQEKINGLFDMATPIKGMIDRIMPVVPQAQVPWLAVSLTFEIFSKPFKEPGINRAGLLGVISKIQEYMSLSDYIVDDNSLQSDLHHKLERDTVRFYQTLLSYQIKSIYCFHKNEIRRFVRNVFKVDDWSSQLDDIKAAEALVWEDVKKFQNQVMVDNLRRQSSSAQSSLHTLTEISMGVRRFIQDQQERENEKDNKECRQHLKQTDPSLDKERILDTKGNLLRESYGWVMDHPQFQDWKTNVHHRRLWIRGDAGKGKTMLLCGIIEELEKDPFHRLCYFFCQATDEKLRDGKCVLRGLLFHLIKQYPWLISHVRKDYDDSGETLFNDHNAWQALRKMFLSVLNDESLDQVTIIVDALDECVTHRDELLKFICDVSFGSRAKFIVSSRPLSTIQKALQGDGSSSSMLALELNDDLISDAVKRLIDNRVASLAKTEPFQQNPDICDEITKHLTYNAKNTFLWVALVCQELSKGTVERISHVKAILKQSPPGLDNLYDQMLETIRRESRDFDICIGILAATSVVTRPVNTAELLCILDANVTSELDVVELERIIMSCGSFLHVQEGVVYFIHQSAVDFLLKDKPLRLPRIPNRHLSVFRSALRALQASPALKRDIYDLNDPGLAREDIKKPYTDPLSPICYPCIHWADHLREYSLSNGTKEHLGSVPTEDVSLVHAFLKTKLLFWIEALSLLQNVPQAVKSIRNLKMLLGGKSSPVDQPVKDFINDAYRFLLYHKYGIEQYPLQLYAACLVFSPKDSIVKSCFQSEAPEWVTVAPGPKSTWDACLQALNEHRFSVNDVAYSHDGQWFASASSDGTVKLWDAEIGTCTHTKTITCEMDSRMSPDCVAFSTSGGLLVAGTLGGIVEVWDISTGKRISKQQAHDFRSDWAMAAMAISSDGYTFAYLLTSTMILIWNRNTEISPQELQCPEKGNSLALSANGEYLAVATHRGCMIWNTLNDVLTRLPIDYELSSVVWSTDGLFLATGDKNSFVEVWETHGGQWNVKFKAQGNATDPYDICHMAFSSDATLLAADSVDEMFVWNIETGALIWAMNDVPTGSMSFSCDNMRLLSTSGSSVRIWDLLEARDGTSRPDYGDVLDLCWSDTDRFLLSSHDNDGIRIFGKGTSIGLYEKSLSTYAISRDGLQVASASRTGLKITIWDAQTGKVLRHLDHNAEEAFFGSKNSQDTAERNIQRSALWAGRDREEERELYPDSLAFGNSFQLASSVLGLIKIWNTSDGSYVNSVDLGDSTNLKMVFSKTGRWLAVESLSNKSLIKTVKLWDTVNGNCTTIGPFVDAFYYDISALSFSADSLLLAVSTYWFKVPSVYILDVSSGDILHSFSYDQLRSIHAQFDSNNERLLHTENGSLDMEDVRVGEDIKSLFRGYSFNYSGHDQWITRDGKRLLWIPDEYKLADVFGQTTPIIDGSRLIWTVNEMGPVQLFFTPQD